MLMNYQGSVLLPERDPSPVREESTKIRSNSDGGSYRLDEEISEKDLIHLQTIPVQEFSRHSSGLSVSPRVDTSIRTKLVTGLPSSVTASEEDLTKQEDASFTLSRSAITSTPGEQKRLKMGQQSSKRPSRTNPKNIMNENPQEFMHRHRQIETEVTGNCMPWSEHVYYKLFLDTEGRLATLLVLKCEITYVDLFTDIEHVLYRSRFIGGKADGVAQIFVYDLMKVAWEDKIPKSQAIELNIDIVLSSSPIYACSETLLNLIKLEKLNVNLRFAHALGWDVKDDVTRNRIHEGLRNLYREGVNLEVMSADAVLEEMRVDEIAISDEERVKHYISARSAWTIPPMKFKGRFASKMGRRRPDHDYDDSSSEEDYQSLDEDDMYHVHLIEKLDKITFEEDEVVESHDEEAQQEDQTDDQGRTSRASTSSLLSKSHTSMRHRSAENTMQTMDDGYYVYLHSSLWGILRDTKRTKSVLEQTSED